MSNEIILSSYDRDAQIVHFDFNIIHPQINADGTLSRKQTAHTVFYNHTIGHAIAFSLECIKDDSHCVQCYCDGAMVFDMYREGDKTITVFNNDFKFVID